MNIQPKDIENKARASGYDGVTVKAPHAASGHPRTRYFGTDGRRKPGVTTPRWEGPGRATALEAAQDKCDYINSGGIATPASLKTAGHGGRRSARIIDEEERAALGVLRDKRAQRSSKAKGYVYCISDGTAVKIGYSLKPEARVAELQTGNPRRLRLLASMQGTPTDEKALHVKYLRHNLLQEWFRPTAKLLSEFGLNKEAINT